MYISAGTKVRRFGTFEGLAIFEDKLHFETFIFIVTKVIWSLKYQLLTFLVTIFVILNYMFLAISVIYGRPNL